VVNKIDLLAPDQRDAAVAAIVAGLEWQGPVFAISAATGEGTDALCRAIIDYLRSAAESERSGEGEAPREA
jgi:GTP-binding protein